MSIKLKSHKYATETCKIFSFKYLDCWQIFHRVINVDTVLMKSLSFCNQSSVLFNVTQEWFVAFLTRLFK